MPKTVPRTTSLIYNYGFPLDNMVKKIPRTHLFLDKQGEHGELQEMVESEAGFHAQ